MKKNMKKTRIVNINEYVDIKIIELSNNESEAINLKDIDEFEKRIERRYKEQISFSNKIMKSTNNNYKDNNNLSYDELVKSITKKNKLLRLMIKEQEN